MLRIGITGGIGSGKSIASRVFGALGVPVYDADSRARWLMEHESALRAALQAAFGSGIYGANHRLNRPLLAGTVFNDPAKLALLNHLVHPYVGTDFARWAEAQQAAGHAYVLKEAALLFETGSYRQLDRVVTVSAPLVVRLARVLRRDAHRTESDVRAIMAKQLSEEEKINQADAVLVNDGTQLLLPQVLALHAAFRAAAA